MNVAVYPGTFDPITHGHSDLVERAAKIFDKIIVAVAENKGKKPSFSLEQRVTMARRVLQDMTTVEVYPFDNLLVDFTRQHQAKVILRGLRAVSDFELEFQLASMNRRYAPNIETLFLIPAEKYTFLSSNLVKEMAGLGADVSPFVHAEVNAALLAHFKV